MIIAMALINRTKTYLLIMALLLVQFNSALALGKAKCNEKITDLKELVKSPHDFKGKHLNIEGKFYSFSALALDYPKAMKSSKEYIGIALSRPDVEEIPLVELKLALPLKKFKKDEEFANIEHGDLIRLRGQVYDVELGEPWLDISSISIIEKAETEEDKS